MQKPSAAAQPAAERSVQTLPRSSVLAGMPVDPGDAQLAQLGRELRFHEADPERARTLTREQVERYNRDGYLTGLPVLTADEVAGHRRWFDALLARVMADGHSSYSIRVAHLRYRAVYALLTHPRILALVRDLIGDDVVAWGTHYFCKLPGDGKVVHWHQDASYWPLSPSKTVTAWLAIDDSRIENACMRVIPGSHRLGHLTYRMAEDTANAVLDQEVENAEAFGAPMPIELDAGSISLHSDLLLHSSRANASTRRRCGLTMRYCAADVRAEYGWNAKGMVVHGRELLPGHWSAQPPTGDE